MRFRLKQDIIIPAGTEFHEAPIRTERQGPHLEYTIGLTKHTSGNVVYALDNDCDLDAWFEPVEDVSAYVRESCAIDGMSVVWAMANAR